MLSRQLQADAITPCQLQRRASASGVVDGADGMNDMLPVTAQASARAQLIESNRCFAPDATDYTYAGRLYPAVMRASPVGQPPKVRPSTNGREG